MERLEILKWLRETNQDKIKSLYKQADDVRRETVGDEVHIRGLCEFSNYCVRKCAYCGIWAGNRGLQRYRMSVEEILAVAHKAESLNYGTIVLQSGEDFGLDVQWLVTLVQQIKKETNLVVTLSISERPLEELKALRQSGADRYLLKFETSDNTLYNKIHPSLPHRLSNRIELLRQMKRMGYETGSGVMIGIPGQTYEILANDLLLFQSLDLDMIGIGPYIPHPDTPLSREGIGILPSKEDQVQGTQEMTLKALALTRILCPEANLPSTTALSTVDKLHGRANGLNCGANIVMPNLTPVQYRKLYDIYPDKTGVDYNPEDTAKAVEEIILSIGRKIGKGRGDRIKKIKKG
jgi:biotin synthase